MISQLYILLCCHFIGDYVFQSNFLAETKGNNWWHLIAHCFLYSVPFSIVFGINWQLLIILISHFIIDSAKARWNKINYVQDQLLHIIFMTIYLI